MDSDESAREGDRNEGDCIGAWFWVFEDEDEVRGVDEDVEDEIKVEMVGTLEVDEIVFVFVDVANRLVDTDDGEDALEGLTIALAEED